MDTCTGRCDITEIILKLEFNTIQSIIKVCELSSNIMFHQPPHELTLSQTSPGFYVSAVQVFWINTVGKGEIAHHEQFLLFPQCFLAVKRTFRYFHQMWNCRLQTLSVWKRLKFVVRKGFNSFVVCEPSKVHKFSSSISWTLVMVMSLVHLLWIKARFMNTKFIRRWYGHKFSSTVVHEPRQVSWIQYICSSGALVMYTNSLPNDKILDRSKLKTFTGDNIKVLKMMIFVFDKAENIVEKGENAGNQHFLLFPQCFQRAFYPGSLKVGMVW